MRTVNYCGIVHQGKGSSLGVSFRDFPGCISAGDDLDELTRNAREALQLHVDGMIADGLTIPAPQSYDPACEEATLMLVAVQVRK
jgi:predicted RNase H-like HicB family nuclease